MGQVLPQHIKDVWDRWNIRGMLLLSLWLQTVLIFFAPTRKRVSAKSLTILLWSCYLLADWSANFAAGLISKNQWSDPKPNEDPPQDKKLMALWSPFLLLHLGGPDTITAFSLEDNALWARHLLGFFFQALVCVFVVLQSLPNPLWPSILLLFSVGIIKYFERTMALNVASSGKFRHSGIQTKGLKRSDVEEGLEERIPTNFFGFVAWMFRGERCPMEIVKPDRDLTNHEIVQHAFTLYSHFTSLISNFVFSFKDLKASQALFNVLNPEEALMILEAELCFIYDALYTKAPVLHTKKGFLFRVIASVSLVWAFCKFHYRDHMKQEFEETDIVITYTLFSAGIALDLASTFVFLLSDWNLALLNALLSRIPGFKSRRWDKKQVCYKRDDFVIEHEVLAEPFLLRRWAGKIYVFNFFDFLLKSDGNNVHGRKDSSHTKTRRPFFCGSLIKWFHHVQSHLLAMTSNKVARYILYPVKAFVQLLRVLLLYIIDRLDVKEFIDDIRVESFVSSEPLTKSMWSFIYEEVRHKSKFADTEENTARISSARGEWALRENRCSSRLIHYVENADYDENLLLWHIATEICYGEEELSKENYDEYREFSKTLSDYMMYLMILQPQLMSEVAGLGMLRFKDAVAEADELLEESIMKSKDVRLAGEKIMSLVSDGDIRELAKESILEGASSIVRELKRLEESHKWKVLSKVWVELLCFASLHCDATARLELLSKGGELFVFVWLSMAHFGLVE